MRQNLLLLSFGILLLTALVLVLTGPRAHATEGFQEGGAQAAAAAAADLQRKVVDIQGTAAAIQSAKEKQDAALSRVLDAETMGMLDFLYAEVRFYLDPSPEREMVLNVLKKMETSTATAAESTLLRMMIGTASQQSQVLFYIYVTLPSTVVSSKLIVDAGEVGATAALMDPKVVVETRQTVEAVLGKLPSPSGLQKAAEGEFLAAAAAVEVAAAANGVAGIGLTAEAVANLTNSFLRYKRLSENLLFQYEQAVRRGRVAVEAATAAVGVDPLKGGGQEATYSSEGIKLDDPALKLAMTNLDMAQKQRIAVLDKVVATMKTADSKTAAAAEKNPANVGLAEVRKTMGAAARTFEDMVAAAGVGAGASVPTKEGFVSVGNPYSSPSPNLQQAFQFRLGKRELVDHVMQIAK